MQSAEIGRYHPGIKQLVKINSGRIRNLGSDGDLGLRWHAGKIELTIDGVSVDLPAQYFSEKMRSDQKVEHFRLISRGELVRVWRENLPDGDRIFELVISRDGETKRAYVHLNEVLWYTRVM